MRRISFIGLFLVLIIAAGCGSPPELTMPGPNSSPPDLKKVASRFHEDPKPNRTVTGDQIPLKFVDLEGKAVDLASFHGKANVVLVVVKGLPQYPGGLFCPGCLAQVNALASNYDEFQKRSAEILMVFPGPTDKVPDFLANAKVDGTNGNPKLPFALLKDADLKAVDSLGIRGDLAKPSTYILDKKGNAVFAFVGETTTDRPSVKALLAQLDKLNGTK
jgi:peroxiredoxin